MTEDLEMRLPVTIRTCTERDLRALEWYGLFRNHREITARAYERHPSGATVMLVADVNGFPVGQVWLDLSVKRQDRVAVLWALRVFPFLRNLGIGTALIRHSESVARARGFRVMEIGVEKTNREARRLYERLGYERVGSQRAPYSYARSDPTLKPSQRL